MVFLLILATNLIDRDNFARVEESVENLYEGEILTKGRILELSILIHEKEIELIKQDSSDFTINSALNENIKELIDGCSENLDSKNEEKSLNDLKSSCDDLFALENNLADRELLFNQIEIIHFNIKDFSDVQVEEGRKEKLASRDAVASAKLFASIEIYLLIFLGIIIQFIVLYRPKKSSTD